MNEFEVCDTSSLTPELVDDLITSVLRRIGQDYLKLGHYFYLAKHKEMYLKLGYATYKEYAEAKIGKYEKAENYRRLWKKIVKDAGIGPEEFYDINPSQANIISKVVTRDNANLWLEKARTMSCSDLAREVKLEHNKMTGKVRDVNLSDASDDETKDVLKKISFTLHDDQLDVVRAALDKAANLDKTEKSGQLITQICMYFLATKSNSELNYETWVKYILSKMEKSLGGTFVWLKDDKNLPDHIKQAIKEIKGD